MTQFILLVLITGFVGAMVGMERSIFSDYAEEVHGVSSYSAMLSFIVAFGICKAGANYFTGRLSQRFGRKKLLVLGWLFNLPVPFILLHATDWNQVVLANCLLGVGQGFAWSSAVIMKIDLVGPKNRGLAMGLNEFAGYLAVGLMTFVTGYLAGKYGLMPYPFYLGGVLAGVGLLLSVFAVHDTKGHASLESQQDNKPIMTHVFKDTTFTHKTLSSVTQAGLINNLNDGMMWGLLPVFLISLAFAEEQVGFIAGAYPTAWGLGQLVTGKMGDHFNKKRMLWGGMLLQAIAILVIPTTEDFSWLLTAAIVLGLGTALVYPTFLTVIGDSSHTSQRPEAIGAFRLWRDLGYAIGAVFSGILADTFGLPTAISTIGVLTMLSAVLIAVRMPGKL